MSKSTFLRHRNRYYDQQAKQWFSPVSSSSSSLQTALNLVEADSSSDKETFLPGPSPSKIPHSQELLAADDDYMGTDDLVASTSETDSDSDTPAVSEVRDAV